MYRCDRPRKRSKKRAIYCPIHHCYLESVSRKHTLFADQVSQLREAGLGRRNAQLLLMNQTTVSLSGEWLEAFWCPECQTKEWYHIKLHEGVYYVKSAPRSLWQQAVGVDAIDGNPSVGEFTRNAAKRYIAQ
ncbi:MAG: hypothetical protein VKJ24_14285 [Synechococcales bacterium]|nr:hypothetical protein [Synechococcales bacterium]